MNPLARLIEFPLETGLSDDIATNPVGTAMAFALWWTIIRDLILGNAFWYAASTAWLKLIDRKKGTEEGV